MISWVAVFTAMVVLDFLWARYIIALRDDNAYIAGALAGSLYVLGGFVTVSFVADYWLLIPAGLGAFVGTVLGSKLGVR